MKKSAIALCLLLVLLPAEAGYFNYSIGLEGKNAVFTTTIGLESSNATNAFKLNGFFLPENSELLSIRDSLGEISDYSIEGNTVSFTSNSGETRKKETVELKYKASGIGQGEFEPLYFAEFSLPGSGENRLEVEVHGERIISFEQTPGFSGETREGALKLGGDGPVGFWVYYSGKGKDYNHFVLFNKSGHSNEELEENGLKEADKLFEIIPLVTGILPPFEKMPLLVLSEEEYLEKINSYSEGVYRTGGLLAINEKAFKGNATAVILHEATHAFNARALKWNESGAAWFDEGMAKFVEETVRELRGEKKPNLFVGTVSWVEGKYKYSLGPRSNLQRLSDYLEEKKEFMEEWDTSQESVREFGYAFSELYVREFIKEKGFEELQKAYREMLEIKEAVEGRAEFSEKMAELLGKSLYPCDGPDTYKISRCVESINSMAPEIPENTTVLRLGLGEREKEFESVGTMHSLKKEILLEKTGAFREKMHELMSLVFGALGPEKKKIIAGLGA